MARATGGEEEGQIVTAFTESDVEDAALAWLEARGWRTAHGPDIAPDALADVVRRTFAALCDVSKSQPNFSDLRVNDAQEFVAEAL